MASKFSPIKSAIDYMKKLKVIVITVGFGAIILGGDFLAFGAFIVSVISFVFSAAITSDAAMRRDIEKRLECFYKPIKLAIGNPLDIEDRVEGIILKFQDITQYDHLAKDKPTRDLFRQLTSESEATTNQIRDIKKLFKIVTKDIIDYEETLAALSSR